MQVHRVGVGGSDHWQYPCPQPFQDGCLATVHSCGLCSNIKIKALCLEGMSSALKEYRRTTIFTENTEKALTSSQGFD